jgi:mRNA deadenylase 3'-5' endonuclease subunit Ccr4
LTRTPEDRAVVSVREFRHIYHLFKPHYELNIATYNVLAESLAIAQTYPYASENALAFD